MQIKSSLLLDISNYYSEKVSQFGCTPNGVDWNGKESQFIRFKQLLKICEQDELFSLGDFGCGYGSIVGVFGIYKMWFCFRGDSYRMGYAKSKNGVEFIRKPGNVIDVSESGWGSEMVSYPSLLKHKNKMYMFYNGNGRTGFGVAISNAEAV